MKKGEIFYQGPVNQIVNYFSKFDYICPSNYNPSDYVMFLIQTESQETLNAKGVGMAISNNSSVNRKRTSSLIDVKQEVALLPASSASFWVQLKWLSYRELLNTKRDVASLIGRFGVTIFLSILYGIIFLNAGNQDDSVSSNFQSHFGAITMTVISSMFGSAQPVMLMFPFERPLFMREYSTGTYGPIAYFISKIVMELPLTFMQTAVQFVIVYFMVGMQGRWIYLVLASWGLGLASSSVAMALGAAVPNVKDVTELAPLLFVPQLLFAGFFTRTSQIPAFLRWAQYLCGIKYSMNLVLMTEFDITNDSCQGGAKSNCETVISSNDIDKDKFWVYIILLVVLFLGFRILASIILVHKAKRFY
jgi:ABC-type multidrug transport system permease subunit